MYIQGHGYKSGNVFQTVQSKMYFKKIIFQNLHFITYF